VRTREIKPTTGSIV